MLSVKLGKKTLLRCVNLLLLVVWAVFIFLNSADDSTASSKKSDIIADYAIHTIFPNYESISSEEKEAIRSSVVYVVRKGAHVTEYAVLGVLMSTLLSQYAEKRKIWYPASLISCIAYASTDEIHQLFVPGRSGQIRDVMIDSIGIVIGCSTVLLIKTLVKRKNKDKSKSHQ